MEQGISEELKERQCYWLERFEAIEKAALKPLPAIEFDIEEWKNAKLHPDCYLQIESVYYSAPHIHRARMLRVKLTEHHVEIFLELKRLARHKDGRRNKLDFDRVPWSHRGIDAQVR